MKEDQVSIENNKELDRVEKNQNKLYNIIIVFLLFIFFIMFVGCEHGFNNFIYSYAHIYLNVGVKWSAYLNSAFGLSLACGRLIGTIASLKLKSHHIILIDLFGCLISFILVILFRHSTIVLWISTILYGFFLASLYPATIDWAQSHVSFNGNTLTILISGGAIGASLIPILIGYSFNSNLTGPFGLIIISITLTIFATVFFFLVLYLSSKNHANSELE